MAALGMCVNTRGLNPLKKPFSPYRSMMILEASLNPVAFLIRGSLLVPLVCNSVFTTSRGVVIEDATAPAKPPAKMCVLGSYPVASVPSTFRKNSYVANWID